MRSSSQPKTSPEPEPEPNIIWRPTPRQAEFLSASEDEVLYGGAAGGGKTDALVIDALGCQHSAVAHGEYRALFLRRTYPELKEVVDRTQAIYPAVYPGAKFNSQDGDWRFPSGARIELSYLERDPDVMRYQSRQYQWIGWEEVAQWPSPYAYEYMISRLRAPERLKLPCVVRATCNPDGPGARWLAERFGILPSGHPSCRAVEVNGRTWRRRFIASKLDDNPHLAGTGYREKLMMMAPEIRRALLDGRWDEPSIPGAIYGKEISDASDDGRIRPTPYDPRLPVHTVWDLGWNDATAIIMLQKPTANSLNIINYLEDSFVRPDQWVAELNTLRYVWGHDWLPHDGFNENQQTGTSTAAILKGLGRRVKPVGRHDPEDGIRAARMLFPRLYIDNTRRQRPSGHSGGARLLDCLRRYHRSIPRATNEPARPVHDENSHAADAFRGLAMIVDQIKNDSEREFKMLPPYANPVRSMGVLG